MDFITLYYRGKLKSNGDARHKHEIRQEFHLQLKRFWESRQLLFRTVVVGIHKAQQESVRSVARGGLQMMPLIRVKDGQTVQLHVQILQPSDHAVLLTGSGDIDNRLKTLLDALQMPDQNQASAVPDSSDLLFCLLEDDAMVNGVQITTGRLWDVPSDSSDVVVIVRVTANAMEM